MALLINATEIRNRLVHAGVTEYPTASLEGSGIGVLAAAQTEKLLSLNGKDYDDDLDQTEKKLAKGIALIQAALKILTAPPKMSIEIGPHKTKDGEAKAREIAINQLKNEFVELCNLLSLKTRFTSHSSFIGGSQFVPDGTSSKNISLTDNYVGDFSVND